MRKKITLISLVVTLFLLGILCYKSWVVGFVVTKYLSGRKDGKQGIVPSIIIPWRNHQIHLHHWLLFLIGGGICAVKGFYILAPDVFYGLLSAIVFQGIYCYGNWHRIVIRRQAALPASTSIFTRVLNVQDYGIQQSAPVNPNHLLTEDGTEYLSTETTLNAIDTNLLGSDANRKNSLTLA